MGMYPTPKVGCSLLLSKIQLHCCFYISAHTKATSIIFIWGQRGYPPVCFEYKTASEQYLVAEISAKQFWVFSKKIFCSKYTQNCFASKSATKYCSEVVFVFKTNGRISSVTSYKDHCCGFFYEQRYKSNNEAVFWKIGRKKKLWVCGKHPFYGPTSHFWL